VTTRAARLDEVGAILALWREAGAAPSATDTADDVAAVIASTHSWLLVAENDGRLAGTLIAAWDGWRGHLYRLAVHPELRRRGIATALLREAERALEAAGAKRIAATVLVDQPGPVGFWESAGYTEQAGRGRFTRNLP
jgi:ribosomal protein S18 acetylase RimI-like enzyme